MVDSNGRVTLPNIQGPFNYNKNRDPNAITEEVVGFKLVKTRNLREFTKYIQAQRLGHPQVMMCDQGF